MIQWLMLRSDLDLPMDHELSGGFANAALCIRAHLEACTGQTIPYDDLQNRCCVQAIDYGGVNESVPVLYFHLADRMHCGVDDPCDHYAFLPDDAPSYFRFHGTKDLIGLIYAGGVQEPCDRPLTDMPGWYHYAEDLGSKALHYANPQIIGTSLYRVVCIYDVRCWHSCKGSPLRDWKYTKAECKSYNLVGCFLAPAHLVSGTAIY